MRLRCAGMGFQRCIGALIADGTSRASHIPSRRTPSPNWFLTRNARVAFRRLPLRAVVRLQKNTRIIPLHRCCYYGLLDWASVGSVRARPPEGGPGCCFGAPLQDRVDFTTLSNSSDPVGKSTHRARTRTEPHGESCSFGGCRSSVSGGWVVRSGKALCWY